MPLVVSAVLDLAILCATFCVRSRRCLPRECCNKADARDARRDADGTQDRLHESQAKHSIGVQLARQVRSKLRPNYSAQGCPACWSRFLATTLSTPDSFCRRQVFLPSSRLSSPARCWLPALTRVRCSVAACASSPPASS